MLGCELEARSQPQPLFGGGGVAEGPAGPASAGGGGPASDTGAVVPKPESVDVDAGTGTTGEPRGVTAPGRGTTSGRAPPLTKVASCSFPRGAKARFCAGVGRGSPPPGGPPQIPRCGSLHVIAPAHG